MQRRQDFGYTKHNYEQQVGSVIPRLLTSDPIWQRREKDEVTGKRTGKVLNTVLNCYYPGLGSQQIYLPAAFKLPNGINDLDEIELINPTGYFGAYNRFYVRADGIKVKGE